MFSACIARLISTYSGLKLQAIINAPIDANNCLEWGNKISKEKFFSQIVSVHPIYNRLIEDPSFMVGEMQFNSIKILVVNFSSTLEYFLKDSLRLNMMRNYSLLKKGLKETNISIDPIDIIEIDDIKKIRLKYINEISNVVCSGELWSKKFRKYIKFLGLPNGIYGESINKKIDAIWRMRNDIAHANTCILSLDYEGVIYKYSSEISADEYTQFTILFIELIDEVIKFLTRIDKLSLEKWEATDGELFYKNII